MISSTLLPNFKSVPLTSFSIIRNKIKSTCFNIRITILVSICLVEYGIGKCSWSCQTWPPGWPVHIQFQDPNKLRKEQLIEIIESMMGGMFNRSVAIVTNPETVFLRHQQTQTDRQTSSFLATFRLRLNSHKLNSILILSPIAAQRLPEVKSEMNI